MQQYAILLRALSLGAQLGISSFEVSSEAAASLGIFDLAGGQRNDSGLEPEHLEVYPKLNQMFAMFFLQYSRHH